jgi:hypothetical protein
MEIYLKYFNFNVLLFATLREEGNDIVVVGHWLPCTLVAVFSVEGCFVARKQDMNFFLSLHQAKTSRLDKQYTCLGQRQCAWQPLLIPIVIFSVGKKWSCVYGWVGVPPMYMMDITFQDRYFC